MAHRMKGKCYRLDFLQKLLVVEVSSEWMRDVSAWVTFAKKLLSLRFRKDHSKFIIWDRNQFCLVFLKSAPTIRSTGSYTDTRLQATCFNMLNRAFMRDDQSISCNFFQWYAIAQRWAMSLLSASVTRHVNSHLEVTRGGLLLLEKLRLWSALTLLYESWWSLLHSFQGAFLLAKQMLIGQPMHIAFGGCEAMVQLQRCLVWLSWWRPSTMVYCPRGNHKGRDCLTQWRW